MAAGLDQACKRVGRVQSVPSELPESEQLSLCGLHRAAQHWSGRGGAEHPWQMQGERAWGLLLGQALPYEVVQCPKAEMDLGQGKGRAE